MTNLNKDDFRILFVYPNIMLQNMMPINIPLLTACLKKAGFNNLKLFDTTLYRTQEISGDEIRANFLQLRKWDFSEIGIELKESNVFDDFKNEVETYNPHLIAVTMTENTYELGIQLLDKINHLNILTIAGGVFPTFSPNDVLSNDSIDMICIGEGEKSIVELCEKLHLSEDYSNIPNLWIKSNDGIIKNTTRDLIDLNDLPFLDFSLFEEQRFYRPNRGKVFKTLPIEISRGCPYDCTFCCASSYRKLHKNKFYREKSISRVIEELKYQKYKFGLEFVYMTSESFLSMPEKRFNEFVEKYEEINLPIFFQTRPETIKYDRLRKFKKFDIRISIGLESGSERIRKEVLNRRFSNNKFIEATKILNDLDIKYGVNNMIGLPDETREDIFETIKLNRQCNSKDLNIFIFVPFRGTQLHKVCVDKGYIPPDHLAREHAFMSSLNMPQISSEEIYGLLRTFPLYVKMPEEYWPQIERAEIFDKEGDKIYSELSEIYYNEYLQ